MGQNSASQSRNCRGEKNTRSQRLRGAIGLGCPVPSPHFFFGETEAERWLLVGTMGSGVRGIRGGVPLAGPSLALATPLTVPTPWLPPSTGPQHLHPRAAGSSRIPRALPIRRGGSTAQKLPLLLAVAMGIRAPLLRRPPRPKFFLPAVLPRPDPLLSPALLSRG